MRELTPEDIERLVLPWSVEGQDTDYNCVVNNDGLVVVPAGSGAPEWMNSEWPTENEVTMIVTCVNERASLLARIAELEQQLADKTYEIAE